MSKRYKPFSRRSFLTQFGKGCATIGATTLLSSITNLGLVSAAAAANSSKIIGTNNNYKALVCILLAGGNDSFNMLVPRGAGEYAEYANVRNNLAIPQGSLLPINPLNPDGKDYGLHPSLPKVQTLFENGDLAFVANIGALVEPTTVAGFKAGTNEAPLGLFSHPDQQKHWQTSVPQDRNALGWGGRLADILQSNNANQDISMNISLNGSNIFQRGANVEAYSIQNSANGSIPINNSNQFHFYEELKRQTLDDLLDVSYQNVLEKAYKNTVVGSKNNSIAFSSAIAASQPLATSFAGDGFSQDMRMVAKTIAARDILDVSNQTFFVYLNGFDTHDNITSVHSELMTVLDNGLKSFNDAMIELGVKDDVVTFTASDFGRKLTSNGNGTDHAWGGNVMVMGGPVVGKKIYGTYPDLYLDNPLDIGYGRLVPTTSCDEYFAELALWFGASTGDLDQILPNINNFWTPSPNTRPIGFIS